MKTMQKVTLRTAACAMLAAAMLLVSTSARAQDWKEIRIGVEGAYPPFSSITKSGQLVGFDIDIALALCKEMKAQCSLVPQDWDGIIPALLARKYDAIIASMSITPERQKKVAFTDKYYRETARFVRRKGSGLTTNISAMEGKTVGVQRATTYDTLLTEKFGSSVRVKRYGTQDEANLDMVAGRLDFLLGSNLALGGGFLATKQGADFEFVGEGYALDEIGIAVRKGDTDLVRKFNTAIGNLRKSGKYQAINRKYFDFDIY